MDSVNVARVSDLFKKKYGNKFNQDFFKISTSLSENIFDNKWIFIKVIFYISVLNGGDIFI